ncbi:MAG TPA: amino acid--tRNA ligase-related protein, partial [Dehalococcoidales bacterium]|nr:amino acid--tRNA ligase-related protein [Dehalococcoidales bacterium]
VDTPVRSPAIAPEKEILPFDSEGWFLVSSPELYMKRLLAAGYRNIYQLSHCFRKNERGRMHNPEFTLLEWYRAGADYEVVIQDTEKLVMHIAAGLGLGDTLKYQGKTIDLAPPWGRITVADLYRQLAGWDPVTITDARRFDEDMAVKVIPCFNPHRLMVVKDYPAYAASLARLKPGQNNVAERAEVFAGQIELANAYSELTGQPEQQARFAKEIESIKKEQGRIAPMPDKFLDSLKTMPESAGIALGIDRLVMLFCDAANIEDVIPFPDETA